jgi:MFS family permease
MLAAVVIIELACGITQGFLAPVLKRLYPVLHTTAADLNWVSIAGLLASVAFVPTLSRLGDLHGRRRVLRWTVAVALAGSVVVGASRSLPVLLIGTAIQASMTGCFPLLAGLVRARGGRADSRRPLGLLVTSLVAGLGIGTLASGLVTHAFAEPTAALWVPAAGMALALAAVWLLPSDRPDPQPRPARSAWVSTAILTVGLTALMLAIGKGGAHGWGWGTPRTLGLLSGGALLIGLWATLSASSPRPVIDPRLFRDRRVATVSLLSLGFSFCMIGPVAPDAIFLGASAREAGYGLGFTPLAVSFALLPNLAALALGAAGARHVAKTFGDRATLATGSALIAAGYLAAAMWYSEAPAFLAALAIVGLGCGLMQFSTRTLAVETAGPRAASTGSGINEILITTGGSLGAAAVLAILESRTPPGHGLPSLAAYEICWVLCSAVAAAMAMLSLTYGRPASG